MFNHVLSSFFKDAFFLIFLGASGRFSTLYQTHHLPIPSTTNYLPKTKRGYLNGIIFYHDDINIVVEKQCLVLSHPCILDDRYTFHPTILGNQSIHSHLHNLLSLGKFVTEKCLHLLTSFLIHDCLIVVSTTSSIINGVTLINLSLRFFPLLRIASHQTRN
jgi:hypothetical protein